MDFYTETDIPGVSLVGVKNQQNQVVQRLHQKCSISIEEECFIAARYSRSNKPVEDIIEEIYNNNVDMADRASKIVVDYGHSSVAEFANVNISFEGISELLALFLLNKINVYAASQRSTRYQEMGTEEFIGNISPSYSTIYQEACSKGKEYGKDAYDSLRYLLPMGTRTSMWISTNLREWGLIISLLKGYDKLPEFVEIGNMIERLLTQDIHDIPAIGSHLLRHTKAHDYSKDEKLVEGIDYDGNLHDLIAGVGKYLFLDRSPISEAVLSNFTQHYEPLPSWFITLQIPAYGRKNNRVLTCDLGQIRDWNRHRSLTRTISFIEYINNEAVVFDKQRVSQVLNDKVPQEFNSLIDNYLEEVMNLVEPKNLYSYPLGYQTKFILGGSFNKLYYTLLLRSKDGGHTAYMEMAKKLLALELENS